jgi:hypothetical protein
MIDSKLKDVLLHLGFECAKDTDVRMSKYIKKVLDIDINDDYESVEQFYTLLYFDKNCSYFLWNLSDEILNIGEKDLKSIYIALNKEFPYIMRKYKISELLNI